MFTLYMKWDARRALAPEDIQFILSPHDALEMASIFYELDYLKYDLHTCIKPHSVPKRREGVHHRFAAQPYKRKHRTQYDRLYDDAQWLLELGWMIGVDTGEKWDWRRNPFSFDNDGNLVYDCFMDRYSDNFQREVRDIYKYTLNQHQGRKPAPTVKQHYTDAPVQHAQATKLINSKAAGRLLAAGGIYNGNIEGFNATAQQLGGDAPAGFAQVMDNKGLIIAGASIAAGLGIGSLGATRDISHLSKIPSLESPTLRGFSSETGILLNAEHAVIDPKKLASYALNPEHPVGGNKARVFESALGYNPTNADVLASRVQSGLLTAPATTLDVNKFGQLMAVDMPVLGVNGKTAIVRTGWMYEKDALVPRLTTLFVK